MTDELKPVPVGKMKKTLDEVIKAMENCYGPDAECCDKCQYTKKISAGSICLKCNLEDDALHYLKEYRKQLTDPDDMIVYLIRFFDDMAEETDCYIPIFSSREKAEKYLRDKGFTYIDNEDYTGWKDTHSILGIFCTYADIEEVKVQ